MIEYGIFYIDEELKMHPCIFAGDSDFEMSEVVHDFGKYRWHDLRKVPDDLPKENGDYIVWYESVNNAYKGAKVMFYSIKTGWVTGRTRKQDGIIAWREIEQFESKV